MDVAKYRALFLEEASEHLAEMGRALLELEKDPASQPAIDGLFRMAHSIKGMAASLGYDAITQVAHRLEDRLGGHQEAGRIGDAEELGRLFRALEGLERMVAHVRDHGVGPDADPDLASSLAEPPGAGDTGPVGEGGAGAAAPGASGPERGSAPKKGDPSR